MAVCATVAAVPATGEVPPEEAAPAPPAFIRKTYEFDGDFVVGGSPLVLSARYTQLGRPRVRNAGYVRLDDSLTTDCRPPWVCGVVLARYLEWRFSGTGVGPSRRRLRGLELGAGVGASGLSLALLGHEVLLSDNGELQAQACRANATENAERIALAGGSARYEELDWRRLPQRQHFGRFDLVIGSDVVWCDEFVEPFVQALLWAASGPGLGEALVAHKLRDESGAPLFEMVLLRAGFSITKKAHTVEVLGGDGHPLVVVYHLEVPAGRRLGGRGDRAGPEASRQGVR